jgi:hypothetical protein
MSSPRLSDHCSSLLRSGYGIVQEITVIATGEKLKRIATARAGKR